MSATFHRSPGRRRAVILVGLSLLLLLLPPAAQAAVPAHGRAWELVSAGPMNGVRLFGEFAWTADGDRIAFGTFGPLPGAPAGDLLAHAVATRTAAGWTVESVGGAYSVPNVDLQPSGPLAVSSDLSSWLWFSARPLLPGAPETPDMGVYRMALDGTLTLLANAGEREWFTFLSASQDATHAAFQTTAHLVPADAGRTAGADAYELAGSELRLVAADDAGAAISTCGSTVGNGALEGVFESHPISRDGERVFFSAPASGGGCIDPQRVYLREHGADTTEVSASQCTRLDCDAPQPVTFAGALPDGSAAFLVTAQQLTNDDVDASADLYRYDVGTHALTRISAGAADAGASAAAVRASADGERVYFLASGALVPGEGTPGAPNLYLRDHGQLRFLATAGDLDLRAAQVTDDGGVLAFATRTPLTPDDTDAQLDVYRYDAAADALTRVSAASGTSGNDAFDVAFGGPSTDFAGRERPRFVSADGRRITFTTAEALLPEDVNRATDVYEWADGSLGLVSSGGGDGAVPLVYGGMSADGRSVFFESGDTLVPADTDEGDADLYVARLGGGFPPPPPPPVPCAGEACQGPVGGRLQRTEPPTLVPGDPGLPLLAVHALGRRALRRLAASGRATVAVDVPLAGRVTAVLRARVDGRRAVVARAVATVAAPQTVALRVRLSRAARRALAARGALRLTLTVRHAQLASAPPIAVRLRSAGS